MVRPTVFALLIIIAAYLPIFLLQRVEGRIFAPMANTVVSALAGALFFSVTLVPVLAALRLAEAGDPPRVAAARLGRAALRAHAALLPQAPRTAPRRGRASSWPAPRRSCPGWGASSSPS